MANLLQFVDSISAAPGVRLDLNTDSTGLRLEDGYDFGNPGVDRLLDSQGQPRASVYTPRVLTLPLLLRFQDRADLALKIGALHRELDRERNLLKWDSGTGAPVFFRTYRSALRVEDSLKKSHALVTLTLPAGPFALGLPVTAAQVTVSNNPAAGANGQFFDVLNVKGDSATPLFLKRATSNYGPYLRLATRRHGDPTLFDHVKQAEAGDVTLIGADTVAGAGPDGDLSGSGTNFAVTTFATTATDADRLQFLLPDGSDLSQARGRYRLLARVKIVNNTAGIAEVHAVVDGVALPPARTQPVSVPHYLDLGRFAIPTFEAPATYGESELPLEAFFADVTIRALRVSGTPHIRWDCFLLLPADEELCVVDATGTDHDAVQTLGYGLALDGPQKAVYPTEVDVAAGTGATQGTAPAIIPRGGLPMLTPGTQRNRIYVVTSRGQFNDAIAHSSIVRATYWPRYEYVA